MEKTGVDHSGHRKRLKKALRENGLSSFSPHEVIELMLYTALPRRDVNELAHRLDDAFGGVRGLLDASESELIGAGAGPASARTIRAYMDCVKAYLDLSRCPSPSARTRGELEKLIKTVSVGEYGTLMLFSAAREWIYTSDLPKDDYARFIARRALSCDAASALVLMNRERPLTEEEISRLQADMRLIDVELSAVVT